MVAIFGDSTIAKTTNYDKYRTMRGNVRMLLSDVTFHDGKSFCQFWMDIELVDPSGVVWYSGRLHRTWGKPASFKSLGSTSGRNIQLRVRIKNSGMTHGANCLSTTCNNCTYTWKGEIVWG